MISDKTTDIVVAIDISGGVTAGHGPTILTTHQSADIAAALHAPRRITVGYRTIFIVITYQATDVITGARHSSYGITAGHRSGLIESNQSTDSPDSGYST